MPQYVDYRVDQVLTNLSVGYQAPEMIADQVFPRLQVPAKNGYYYVFDRSKFRAENDVRAGVTRANRVDYGLTKTSFGPLLEHSLEEAIEYDVRDSFPTPYSARADATENVTFKLQMGHEKAVADLLTNTSVITQNTTLSGTSQWSDFANSDPFGDIQTGFDTIVTNGMVTPNVLVLGYQVWAKLKNHPDLLGRMSTASVRTLTEDLLASLVGVEKVLIGKGMRNTADEGQADSMSFIWGKNAILMYVNPRAGVRSLTTGYTLELAGGRSVDRWDEPQVKAEFVRATDFYEAKLVSAAAAYLIKNAVA